MCCFTYSNFRLIQQALSLIVFGHEVLLYQLNLVKYIILNAKEHIKLLNFFYNNALAEPFKNDPCFKPIIVSNIYLQSSKVIGPKYVQMVGWLNKEYIRPVIN